MMPIKFGFDEILADLLNEPVALRSCLKYYSTEEGKQKLDKVRADFKAGNFKRVIFLGVGSFFYVLNVPYYMLNSNLNSRGTFCEIHEASEFLNFMIPRQNIPHTLIILVSRTGESKVLQDIVTKLDAVGFDRKNVWALVNNENSTVAQRCNNVLHLMAGKEVIRSSKTFMHAILVSYFLCRAMLDEDPINNEVAQEIRNLIYEIDLYESQWELNTDYIVNFIGEHFRFLFLASRGASQATSMQVALTCNEYAHIIAEATTIDTFRFGPLQMVDPSFRSIIISGSRFLANEPAEILQLVSSITSKIGQGKVVVVTNSREIAATVRANHLVFVFEHTTVNPYLAPIFEMVVLQFMILKLARKMDMTT